MSAIRRKRWLMATVLVVALVAIALFGVWRWAVAAGSAGLLDRIDSVFPRQQTVALAAEGTYGPGRNQNGELWVPDGTPPAGGWPLAVFVYGGGWHSGSTADYRFVARTLADRGFATALVGYRLVQDGGRFPAMLQDTAAGVRWARDHAKAANVRSARIALIGHSAGAYNVTMLTLDPQWLAAAGVPESAIGGTVSLAGPMDFHPFTSDSARNALGHAPDPALTQPVTFARAGAPPLMVLHGTSDDVVKPRNGDAILQAMARVRGDATIVRYDGMSHAGIIMALSKPFAKPAVMTPLIAFLRRATGPASAPGSVPGQMPDEGTSDRIHAGGD